MARVARLGFGRSGSVISDPSASREIRAQTDLFVKLMRCSIWRGVRLTRLWTCLLQESQWRCCALPVMLDQDWSQGLEMSSWKGSLARFIFLAFDCKPAATHNAE